MEQRAVIKFHAKLGKSGAETFRLMQQVYGDQCMSRTTFFVWHKRFVEGRETLEDNEHSGRPISARTPEMIEKVRDFISNDRSASVRMMEEQPTGQTITGEFYLEVLHRLMARIRRVRPHYRDPESWCLLHDNAPSHTSLIVRQFLARNRVAVINHPPYSPDLAPCDFFLFPRLKLKLKGSFFEDIPAIQTTSTHELEAIPQNELEHAFESL